MEKERGGSREKRGGEKKGVKGRVRERRTKEVEGGEESRGRRGEKRLEFKM